MALISVGTNFVDPNNIMLSIYNASSGICTDSGDIYLLSGGYSSLEAAEAEVLRQHSGNLQFFVGLTEVKRRWITHMYPELGVNDGVWTGNIIGNLRSCQWFGPTYSCDIDIATISGQQYFNVEYLRRQTEDGTRHGYATVCVHYAPDYPSVYNLPSSYADASDYVQVPCNPAIEVCDIIIEPPTTVEDAFAKKVSLGDKGFSYLDLLTKWDPASECEFRERLRNFVVTEEEMNELIVRLDI